MTFSTAHTHTKYVFVSLPILTESNLLSLMQRNDVYLNSHDVYLGFISCEVSEFSVIACHCCKPHKDKTGITIKRVEISLFSCSARMHDGRCEYLNNGSSIGPIHFNSFSEYI